MAFIERSVRALLGVLAIASCRTPTSPAGPMTSSVVVEDAGRPALPVIDAPKEVASTPVDASAPITLRDVDWPNHDYGGWGTRLHDGYAESHVYGPGGGAHDTMESRFVGVAYGDLDGDSADDAVVVIKETTWIAATSRETSSGSIHVFALRGGDPAKIATDYFIGVPTGVRVRDRTVIIDESSPQQKCVREMKLVGDKLTTVKLACQP